MQVHLMRFGAFLVTTLSLTCISADELRSGRSTLEVNTNGIRLRLGNERFTSEKPIDLRLAIGEEPATALRGAYRSVSRNEGKLVCTSRADEFLRGYLLHSGRVLVWSTSQYLSPHSARLPFCDVAKRRASSRDCGWPHPRALQITSISFRASGIGTIQRLGQGLSVRRKRTSIS